MPSELDPEVGIQVDPNEDSEKSTSVIEKTI